MIRDVEKLRVEWRNGDEDTKGRLETVCNDAQDKYLVADLANMDARP